MPLLLACFALMNPRNLVKAAVFVLALAAQPAFSAAIFVDAAAPPGGDGSTPAHAFTSLVDAVAAARAMQREGALVIHLAAGTYALQDSRHGDGLLIDVPTLRLEGETELSFDAAGVPQAVIGGATRITGVAGKALLRVRADGVSLSGLILDGVDRNVTSWTLVADGSPNFTMSQCVSYNAFFGVLVRSASATLEQNIFGTPAAGNQMGALVAGGPPAANVSVVFQRNRVEGNGFLGAVFMGDNAAVASAYDPSVDSALHATIAGNEFVGNTVGGLALSLRENPSISAVDHTAYLVAPCTTTSCATMSTSGCSSTLRKVSSRVPRLQEEPARPRRRYIRQQRLLRQRRRRRTLHLRCGGDRPGALRVASSTSLASAWISPMEASTTCSAERETRW